MAEQTITLRKPLFEERGGGAPPRPAPKEPAGPRPVPLFAGFWIRFLALSFDVMLVAVVHHLAAALGAREAFFRHAAWTPLLGAGALFALFVAVPVTLLSGQTLGQKMVRIRVVRADGKPAPAGALAVRFLIIFSLFIPQWIVAGPLPLRDWLTDRPAIISALTVLVLSLCLTQVLLFALHPLKRGLHDLCAGTFVLRLDAPPATPAEVLGALDAVPLARIRRTQTMAMILLPALSVIFASQILMGRDRAAEAQQRTLRHALRAVAGPGVDIGVVTLPMMASPECYVLQVVAPPSLPMAWSGVASSEAYRDLAARVLAVAEEGFDPGAAGPGRLRDVPFAGSVFIVAQTYVVVPGLPQITGTLAGGLRVEWWNRQIREVPLGDQRVLPGTPLIPFTPASASPEAPAPPAEAVASPETLAAPVSL